MCVCVWVCVCVCVGVGVCVCRMAGERAEKEKALEQGMDPTLIKGVAE